jgi:hypothetical protein
MQCTQAKVKLREADAFSVIVYGVEMPEGMNPAVAGVARGIGTWHFSRFKRCALRQSASHQGRAENGKFHRFPELLRV